jgi:hypothetical protein
VPQKRDSDYRHLETDVLNEGILSCPPPLQPA